MFKNKFKKSYSQCGEDVIVDFIFNCLGIDKINYLDIGAYDPIVINNTYLFYRKGCNGVLIEPNPYYFNLLKKIRKRDICLNIGIGDSNIEKATFSVLNKTALSAFDVREVLKNNSEIEIRKQIDLPILSINKLIKKYFDICPNFISIDIEGLDLAIVKNFDFNNNRPDVLCVETLTYTRNNTENKVNEIIEYVCQQGYILYADTFINSIFVDKIAWKNRKRN